jgi:hypothetical protein
VARTFTIGKTRIEPTLDLFNMFNNNAVTSAVTTVGLSLAVRPRSSWDGWCVSAGE